MGVLVSHPTGNANVRAVLAGLASAKLLDEFHTTIALPSAAVEAVASRYRGAGRLRQRSFPEVADANVVQHATRELVRQAARRLGLASLQRHERGWASVDAVYHALDTQVAKRIRHRMSNDLGAVYCYEDGALASFMAAQYRGLTRFYDLPIAYWRTLRHLLHEEAERWPEWAPTMGGLYDSNGKCERKDAELALANRVLVASSFTKRSLIEHFGDTLDITVTPYGCPSPRTDVPARRSAGAPLRLLFAGHLSQRKGLADLIAALERVDIDWRLTLAGALPAQVPEPLRKFLEDPRCQWLGAIPHAALLRTMQDHHLFVFPSIVEGFGMVITEAMAAGLPVITTPNTAGPDLMTDGMEGFIVRIRDPDAIAERVARLGTHEERRLEMGANALAAAHRNAWAGYELQIAGIVRKALRS